MSRADFEEYWARRNTMIKELVGTMRLHRALGDVEGLFQKMVGEIVPLSGWLHEKDPKAHRIVNYINEIIIAEWHFKNKDEIIQAIFDFVLIFVFRFVDC